MKAVRYLQGRGFDVDYLDYLGVGYCSKGKYEGRIIIPFFIIIMPISLSMGTA